MGADSGHCVGGLGWFRVFYIILLDGGLIWGTVYGWFSGFYLILLDGGLIWITVGGFGWFRVFYLILLDGG
jgi:hypothetical protein